jgi:hypothetical protein
VRLTQDDIDERRVAPEVGTPEPGPPGDGFSLKHLYESLVKSQALALIVAVLAMLVSVRACSISAETSKLESLEGNPALMIICDWGAHGDPAYRFYATPIFAVSPPRFVRITGLPSRLSRWEQVTSVLSCDLSNDGRFAARNVSLSFGYATQHRGAGVVALPPLRYASVFIPRVGPSKTVTLWFINTNRRDVVALAPSNQCLYQAAGSTENQPCDLPNTEAVTNDGLVQNFTALFPLGSEQRRTRQRRR